MAKYNLKERRPKGVTGASASDFYNQIAADASQTIVKQGKASYPLARLTTRASSRAKVQGCGEGKDCLFQEQRVRIEVTGLAAGTTEQRQELMKLLIRAASEAQALIKAGAVIGYSPESITTDDSLTSLPLNLTGASGVAG